MFNTLIAGLAIAIVLSATPGLAQMESLRLPPPLPTVGYDMVAQSEGQVSLPDPNSPGDPLPSDFTIPISPDSPIHGANVRAAGGPNTGTQAELSMAVSGPHIVISFNGGTNGGGYVSSTDGGVTWGATTSPPRPANSNPCCDTAVAADFLGRFYYLELYRDDGAGNCTNSLHVSNNGGQTFGGILSSPFSYASGTTDFPDMPHFAIDRVNLVGGNPQVYVFTRHFTSGINCPQTGNSGSVQGEVTCSNDGGATWIAPIVLSPFTDLAHLATGSDGSVYIVGNGSGGTILLRRSTNSCDAGLSLGSAVTVASGLTYGSVGIDREFPQPYVAVDKLDPDVAYVAWSSDRLASDNDRDVFLCRCTFSGTSGSCEAPVRINDDPVGTGNDQYFPMLAVDPNNTILLQWNDQRAGNRSTAIYHAEVKANASALAVGPSYLVSEVNFTPFNFGGTPDYGDYNENNDAVDGRHFYTAWTSHVSPPGMTPASNDPDIFFAVVNNLQDVRVAGSLDFGDVCRGVAATRGLTVYNVGDAFLTVSGVARIAGSTDFTVDPNPTLPLTIGPGGHVDFVIRCTPTGFGLRAATIRVTSDDPDQREINLTYTCNTPPGDIEVTGSTDFGDVCIGDIGQQTVSVCNVGPCNLNVTSVSLDGTCTDLQLVGNPFPGVVSENSCLDVVIQYAPTAVGSPTCNLVITSNDPDTPTVTLPITANTPPGDIRVTGSTEFGAVCADEQAEKTIEICNVGECNLNVTSVAFNLPCPDFEIVNNPFPAPLSHDACMPLTIRFTPSSVGPKSCQLVITSDDPDQGTITLQVTADTPLADIDVPDDLTFPPTVIQDLGACRTLLPFPISNTGECNLTIDGIQLGGAHAADYSLVGLPSFPIILEPGHVVGEGDLAVAFAPTVLARERSATVTVTYVADPIAGTTAQETRELCGEGVKTGVRVLVVNGAQTFPTVDRLKLLRVVGNRRTTTDLQQVLPLSGVVGTPPCPSFQFHREYGTVSNPTQLLPGNYELTATVRIGGRNERRTVYFDVSSCTFNPNIVIDFSAPLAGGGEVSGEVPGAPVRPGDPAAAPPAATALTGIHPNPFNPSTTVSFDLASEEAVSVRVYSERGSLLRTLSQEGLPAGRYELVWDGRDEAGSSMPSGVYLIQFTAGSVQQTAKALLVK